MVKKISIIFVVLVAGVAWAAENVVSNGGFEAGTIAPWLVTSMSLAPEGARTGNYGAYYFTQTDGGGGLGDAELVRWCDLRQDLGRTIEPDEFLEAVVWVYYAPDKQGNPWYLDVALGHNELRLESPRGELARGWNRVVVPAASVTVPFTYVYIKPSLAIG